MGIKCAALILALLLPATPCLAGSTTISGTMGCTMPEHVTLNQAGPSSQTPTASSTGPVEITRQDRPAGMDHMVLDESQVVRENGLGQAEIVTIYTACAR